MFVHFSSIYLSMHLYVLLILPHHLRSSHGFPSSSAPGNTETHAFRPVLSRMFFCDSNSRLRRSIARSPPQVLCCFNGVVRMWKKTVESWEVWDFGSNKHFQVMTSSSYHPTRFLCFWCFQGLDLSNLWTRIAFVFFSSRDFPSIFCSNRMISKIFFMNLGKWSTYQRLLLNFLDIYPVYLI